MLEWISLNLPILLCLIIGMGLLVVEMIMPGFGLPGLSGLVLLGVALFLTWQAAGGLAALLLFLIIIVLVGIAVAIVVRSTKRGKLSRSWFVLREASTKAAKPMGGTSVEAVAKLGSQGITLTPLRPAGMAQFAGERLNVVSDGEFIAKDSHVVIERIEGARIVVKTKGGTD
ncbi:membrane protein [Clostridia bacterium]|nr:membrane protein [Clostridia bacterium]